MQTVIYKSIIILRYIAKIERKVKENVRTAETRRLRSKVLGILSLNISKINSKVH